MNLKMKMILKLVISSMMLVSIFSFGSSTLNLETIIETTYAQTSTESTADNDGFINDSTKSVLERIQRATGLPVFGFENDNQVFNNTPGLNRISSLVFSVISILKYIVLSLTIFILAISLFRVITSTNPDEELDKLKQYVIYLVIAIVIILSADVFFLQALNLRGAGFLANSDSAIRAARIGSREILGMVRVVEYMIGAIALTFLVIAGFRLASNAGNEDVIDKAKKQIIYSVVGVLLVLISESLVREIFFVNDGASFDVNAANRFIVTLTNFISGFIAIAAVISLLYAGFSYVFNPGSDENSGRAKNAIIGAVVGIIIAAGAFAVVNTVIKLDPNEGAPIPIFDQDYVDTGFEMFNQLNQL